MTKEQLADLDAILSAIPPTAVVRIRPGKATDAGAGARLVVYTIKLLQERKKLLEALNNEWKSDRGVSQEGLAAIRFAEEKT